MGRHAAAYGLALCMALAPGASPAAEPAEAAAPKPAFPFHPGEKLTYTISWSNIVQAGTAVMEVHLEKTPDGRDVLRFVSKARSAGLVDKFYTVLDTIESVFDPLLMQSLSYRLDQLHGKRKRHRELSFDHEKGTVTYTSDGDRHVINVPAQTQDALSSLYYLRTREDFTPGKANIIVVHDSGKNWSVEVQTLGREKLKTSLGEFDTIKVRTYPKYEGVFMHKGEIDVWLTDDSRRIPLLMKSTIAIGSIMATLTEIKTGDSAK